jgi:hypothetical protein
MEEGLMVQSAAPPAPQEPAAAEAHQAAATKPTEPLQIEAFRYAWDWFSYHASQRMLAFRFFLIMIAALAYAYQQSLAAHLPWMGFLIGMFGALVSVGFWAVEIRNEELVNCGRQELDSLESAFGVGIRKRDRDRTCLPESGDWLSKRVLGLRTIKTGFWLRTIQAVAFLLFVGGACYSLGDFSGTTKTPNQPIASPTARPT